MIYLLHHIIEHAARRSPDREAFRCRGQSMTYAQLDARSASLAALLQQAGIRPGDRVAICMPKCPELAVSVFGCLKAGAVYVPVDPGIPAQRMKTVLNDAGVSAVLTHQLQRLSLLNVCTALNRLPSLLVGAEADEAPPFPVIDWKDIPGGLSFTPPNQVEDDAAYMIYTSGSTGEPKGILHTHRSGLSYARLAVDVYGVCETDRLGNFAPLHFDQSTFDFFSGPLACATTVMIPEAHTRFPASLAQLIDDERLTIWYSVPFALVQLLLRGALEARDLSSLRWVLFGGEPFPIRHLRDLMLRLPTARFSNVYGPAEVNQCTYYNVPCPPDNSLSSLPIGRVWPNTEFLIVDDEDLPVAAGEIGELLIRSPTMMTGYWMRPQLNAKAFFDQHRNGIACRYFRTGDLVQEIPDGNLAFHGRKDRQVKIRGHRVELDEVEAAILKVPVAEKAAAFAVRDPLTDDRRILAAVVSRAGASLLAAEVLAVVTGILPGYAIPSEVLITQEFPQTTTGKTDYRALERQLLTVGDGELR